jgi:hypothetical protein
MTNPIVCPRCQEYRFIEYEGVRFQSGTKSIGVKLPLFKCKKCGLVDSVVRRNQIEDFVNDFFSELEENEFFECPLKFIASNLDEEARFTRFDHLQLKYDPRDHFVIPGLYRPHDIGYLTPVFFDKDVLLYYNAHPDYSVKLGSFSSGNIYFKGEQLFNWGFGITRSGKIFKWLGDLDQDFHSLDMQPHLRRFQASNVDSDHDIVSKFYFSQNPFTIEDAFQASDNEMQLFNLKEKFEELILKQTQIHLSKIDIDKLSEYYKPPILNERSQVFNAFLSLTKLLIEGLETDQIKSFLKGNGIADDRLKSLKGLKLLELFLEVHWKRTDTKQIITPFYVLYDLRLLQGHLAQDSFEARYDFCKERLGLPNDANDFDVYIRLIERLIGFYKLFSLE